MTKQRPFTRRGFVITGMAGTLGIASGFIFAEAGKADHRMQEL